MSREPAHIKSLSQPHYFILTITIHTTSYILHATLYQRPLFHTHASFLESVEKGYNDSPYHNATHAADVLHMAWSILSKGQLSSYLDNQIAQLAMIYSAIVHDLEHRGVNNDYLVRTQDPLAVLYNDQSPLENHHLAVSFKRLYRDNNNFIKHMNQEDQVSMHLSPTFDGISIYAIVALIGLALIDFSVCKEYFNIFTLQMTLLLLSGLW